MQENLNLIEDAWLPVVRRSGKADRIHIAALLEAEHEDPVITIDYDAPDLRAGAFELVLCIYQTAAAPRTEKEWRDMRRNPPSEVEVQERLAPLAPYFWLDHEKHPFMQDASITKPPTPIEPLTASRPPSNSTKQLRDFLRRSDEQYSVSLDEAMIRLFMEHVWTPISTPKGGSYRGHGPLTSLVQGTNVGHSILLNLLPVTDKPGLNYITWKEGWPDQDQPDAGDEDPRRALWMLRRTYRLHSNEGRVSKVAAGAKTKQFAYLVPHPHSAGHYDAKSKWVAKQGRALQRTLPGLLSLTFGDENQGGLRPSRVVSYFRDQRAETEPQAGLHSFGYVVYNNVDAWNEMTFPLPKTDEVSRVALHNLSALLETGFKQFLGAAYNIHQDAERRRAAKPSEKALPFSELRNEYYARLWPRITALIEKTTSPTRADIEALMEEAASILETMFDRYASQFNPHETLAGTTRGRTTLRLLPHAKKIKAYLETFP